MVRAAFVGLLLGVCLLGACAGKTESAEDATGGTGGKAPVKTPPKSAAPQACNKYVSTWCARAFACYVQVGRLDAASRQYNVDQCTQLIEDQLPCSAATSVGSAYDTCLTQIKGIACSKWDVPQAQFATVVPPASCDEALAFGE